MNKIQLFKNEKFGQIRTYQENEQIWFCLKDLCEILEIKNASDCKNRLNSKGVVTTDTLTNGGNQKLIYINESNLYKVIFQSRKQEAEQFTEWVTSEVLPSIRKHGIYAADNVIDKILNNPDFGIELLTKLKEEKQARVEAEKKNAILMHVNKTYTSTEIAKECNLKSAIKLNNVLSENKIQFKQNDTWVLYSKYSNCGYVEIKQEVLDSGKIIYHRRWTQLGRNFILNLLGKSNE